MQRQEWTFCGELLLHVKAEKVGVYLTRNILLCRFTFFWFPHRYFLTFEDHAKRLNVFNMKVFAPNPIIHGQYRITVSVPNDIKLATSCLARYLQVLFSDSFVVIGAMLTSINLITIRDYWIHLSVMFISFVLDCWLVPVLPRILCKSGILTTDLPHTVKSHHAPILVSAEKVRHGALWCQDQGNNFVTGVPCPGDILSLRDPIPSAGHQLRVACQSKPGCNIKYLAEHHPESL